MTVAAAGLPIFTYLMVKIYINKYKSKVLDLIIYKT